MDEGAIRRELEHSGDDEDYISDLDEEFRDLSSEEDNGVNQVSRAEPSCKKARISVRTLPVDSEDSEEEIRVERTVTVTVTVTVKQMLPLVVEVVVLEEIMAMEKKQKVMVLIVNMMMRIWMSVVLVMLLYREKQPHNQEIATKM
jgi:hypothetical protein